MFYCVEVQILQPEICGKTHKVTSFTPAVPFWKQKYHCWAIGQNVYKYSENHVKHKLKYSNIRFKIVYVSKLSLPAPPEKYNKAFHSKVLWTFQKTFLRFFFPEIAKVALLFIILHHRPYSSVQISKDFYSTFMLKAGSTPSACAVFPVHSMYLTMFFRIKYCFVLELPGFSFSLQAHAVVTIMQKVDLDTNGF